MNELTDREFSELFGYTIFSLGVIIMFLTIGFLGTIGIGAVTLGTKLVSEAQ